MLISFVGCSSKKKRVVEVDYENVLMVSDLDIPELRDVLWENYHTANKHISDFSNNLVVYLEKFAAEYFINKLWEKSDEGLLSGINDLYNSFLNNLLDKIIANNFKYYNLIDKNVDHLNKDKIYEVMSLLYKQSYKFMKAIEWVKENLVNNFKTELYEMFKKNYNEGRVNTNEWSKIDRDYHEDIKKIEKNTNEKYKKYKDEFDEIWNAVYDEFDQGNFDVKAVLKKYGYKDNEEVKEIVKQEPKIKSETNINKNTITKPKETKSTINADFKKMVDTYEEFINDYCNFMNEYKNSNDVMAMLSDYTEYMGRYTEELQKFNSVNQKELTTEELKYYLDAQTRVLRKISSIGE